MKKTLILHHSADLDGILSGVIAEFYLSHRANPDDIIICHGADYGDCLEISYGKNGEYFRLSEFDEIYVIDFSDDWLFESEHANKIIWIDHHIHAINKAIEKQYPIRKYVIDGVAACRLTQQFMCNINYAFLDAYAYRERKVDEPLMVALAGEYDIWDETSIFARPFNFGVCCNLNFNYVKMLYEELKHIKANYKDCDETQISNNDRMSMLVECGKAVIDNIQRTSSALKGGVPIEINGLKGRAFNTHIRSSLIHRLQDPDKFIMVWNYTGSNKIKCSFYSSEGTDISVVAKYFGGGGHIRACGCTIDLHILTHILTKPYECK